MSDPQHQIDSAAIHERAREWVRAFLLAYRTLRTHGRTNDVGAQALDGFVNACNAIVLTDGSLDIRVVEEFLYFSDTRLRPPRSDAAIVAAATRELAQRGIGRLSLGAVIDLNAAATLLETLAQDDGRSKGALDRLSERLQARGNPFQLEEPSEIASTPGERGERSTMLQLPVGFRLVGVKPTTPESASAGSPGGGAGTGAGAGGSGGAGSNDEELDAEDAVKPRAALRRASPKRARTEQALSTALAVSQVYLQSAFAGERIEMRHGKRAVQSLVDRILDDDSAVLGLAALRSADNYTFHHGVNVCVLSIALGKRLGLPRERLAELGVAALFHDLGKAHVPPEILRKKGAFTPEERAIVERHPLTGARELLRMMGLTPLAHAALLGCFEHHLWFDGASGYPRVSSGHRPSLFGRIVAIADCFDALSTKRVYMKERPPRADALAYLLGQGESKFDPRLLRLFVNMVGVYPIGSEVQLASGRTAIVKRIPEDASLSFHPIVVTLPPGPIGELDLSERGVDGRYVDEITSALPLHTLDPMVLDFVA